MIVDSPRLIAAAGETNDWQGFLRDPAEEMHSGAHEVWQEQKAENMLWLRGRQC